MASQTEFPVEIDTSRSVDKPPIRTPIFFSSRFPKKNFNFNIIDPLRLLAKRAGSKGRRGYPCADLQIIIPPNLISDNYNLCLQFDASFFFYFFLYMFYQSGYIFGGCSAFIYYEVCMSYRNASISDRKTFEPY